MRIIYHYAKFHAVEVRPSVSMKIQSWDPRRGINPPFHIITFVQAATGYKGKPWHTSLEVVRSRAALPTSNYNFRSNIVY
jgi:hypothetical protein